MAEFPTLGLNFDLTGIVTQEEALTRLQQRYEAVGMSAAEAEKKAQAAAGAVGRAMQGTTEASIIGSQASARANQAEAQAIIDRIARYEQLKKIIDSANLTGGGGAAQAKARANELLEIDRGLLNSRIGLARQYAGQEQGLAATTLAFQQKMWAGRSAAARATLAEIDAGVARAAKNEETTAAQVLALRQRLWRQQAAAAAQAAKDEAAALAAQGAPASMFGAMSAQDAAGIERAAAYEAAAKAASAAQQAEAEALQMRLLRIEAEGENARRDQLAADLVRREHATAASHNRLHDMQVAADERALRQEATTEAKFLEMLRLRTTAGVGTSGDQLALYKATASINGFGPDVTAELAKIEAINRALADAKKAQQGSDFLANLNQLDQAGKKFTAFEANLKSLQAAELGVAAAADPIINGMRKVENTLAHTGGTAFKVREAFVLMREGLRGDMTRMAGSATLMAQAFGLLSLAVLQVLAVATLLAAPFVIFFALVEKGASQLADFNNAMKATGDAAGVTFDQMYVASKKLAESTDNTTSAMEKTMTAVVATGKVSGQAISDTTEAATRLADLTHEKTEAVAKSLIQWYGDAANGAAKLNESVHFLTLGQYEQIKALQDAGDSTGAYDLAVKDLVEHLRNEGTPEMNAFAETFHNLHTWVDKAIQKIEELGRKAPLSAKINHDLAAITALQQRGETNSPAYSAAIQMLQADQDALAKQDSDAAAKGVQSRTNAEGIEGFRRMQAFDTKIKGNEAYIQSQLDDYQAAVAAALRANPNDAQAKEDQAHMAERLAALRKRLEPHTGSATGVQNQLGKMQAQARGLLAQALNPATDPISQALEQIKTAGAQARGSATAGTRAGYADQLAAAASEVKRLEIIKQINGALDKQIESQRRAQAEERAAFGAYQEAAQAQAAYYTSGSESLEGYIALQQRLVDIQEKAKEEADAIRVIQQTVGATDPVTGQEITTMDQARARLHQLANGNKELEDSMVARLQTAVAVTQQTDRQAASDDKARIAMDALTSAQRAYADELEKVHELQKVADQASSFDRAAQALVTMDGIYRVIKEAQLQGVNLTHEQAEAIERANQKLVVMRQYYANLEAQMKDAFEQTFVDTGKLDFKGLQNGFTKALRKAVYDALIAKPIDIVVKAEVQLLQSVIQPFLDQIGGSLSKSVSSLFGGGDLLGNLLGGSSSPALQDFTNAATGMTDTVGYLDKAGKSLNAASSSLSSVLGTAGEGAMLGASLGSGIDGLFGKKQGNQQLVQAGIGGAAGALIGAAFFGPIGAVVGGILGGMVGGAFGPGPSNFTATGNLTRTYATYGGDKPNSDTNKLAQAASQAVLAGEKALTDMGVKLNDYVTQIAIGQRDNTHITLSNGTRWDATTVGDPAEAANEALLAVLKTADGFNDAQKKLIDSMTAAGQGFDDIIKVLQAYRDAQARYNGIDREILKYTDPQAYALANLRDNQIARRNQAISDYQSGYLTSDQMTTLAAKLSQLEKLEIIDTLSQFSNGVEGATASLADFQAAQQKILDYANGLLVGQLSPLSPRDQLNTAASQFYATLSAAQGGDKTALDGLTGKADTYLGQAHSFYASSSAYADIFAQVEAALHSLGTQAYPGTSAGGATTADGTAVVDALAQLQDAITQNNADLITAISPATNDNATGADIAAQTGALTSSLADVQQTIAASTEAITSAINGNVTATPLSLTSLMNGGSLA